MYKPLWPQVLYGSSSKTPRKWGFYSSALCMCLTGVTHHGATCHHLISLFSLDRTWADFQKPWTAVQLRRIPRQTKGTTGGSWAVGTAAVLQTVLPSSYPMYMLQGEDEKLSVTPGDAEVIVVMWSLGTQPRWVLPIPSTRAQSVWCPWGAHTGPANTRKHMVNILMGKVGLVLVLRTFNHEGNWPKAVLGSPLLTISKSKQDSWYSPLSPQDLFTYRKDAICGATTVCAKDLLKWLHNGNFWFADPCFFIPHYNLLVP